MKNRIETLFAERTEILSVFYTAGFPKRDDTVPIAIYLEKAGVDLIEIGIPFSDPIADGPVIQDSNKIALSNGMTVGKLLEQVREIRKSVELPIILMGYINPLLQYGMKKFCEEAAMSGVDGVILPDLPMDEFEAEYKTLFHLHGLSNIFLISPTTSVERIRKIDEATRGFIYAVSASSTTGAKGDFNSEQKLYFKRLQNMKLRNPFLVGFGITNSQNFSEVCQYGAGAIVGSAFISMMKDSIDFKKDILHFVKALKGFG